MRYAGIPSRDAMHKVQVSTGFYVLTRRTRLSGGWNAAKQRKNRDGEFDGGFMVVISFTFCFLSVARVCPRVSLTMSAVPPSPSRRRGAGSSHPIVALIPQGPDARLEDFEPIIHAQEGSALFKVHCVTRMSLLFQSCRGRVCVLRGNGGCAHNSERG